MVFWTNLRKISALSSGTGLSLYLYYYVNSCQNKVYASWTETETPINSCAIWDSNWDCRSPKCLVRPPKNGSPQEDNRYNTDLEKATVKATRHIIMVRHGEYTELGETDEHHRLTERGRLQAQRTGQRLNEFGIKFDKVIVSTMMRAQETAKIILHEIHFDHNKIINCPYIREGAPIPPQPPVGHWKPEESFFRDGARIEAGFRRYFYRALPTDEHDTYTLIVGHGNVIRYFVCRALQLPPEAWLRISINHASITWLTIQPSGNVSIKCLGDSGFMPAKLLTSRMPTAAKNVATT